MAKYFMIVWDREKDPHDSILILLKDKQYHISRKWTITLGVIENTAFIEVEESATQNEVMFFLKTEVFKGTPILRYAYVKQVADPFISFFR